jgi:hypothetical protein
MRWGAELYYHNRLIAREKFLKFLKSISWGMKQNELFVP